MDEVGYAGESVYANKIFRLQIFRYIDFLSNESDGIVTPTAKKNLEKVQRSDRRSSGVTL